MTPPSLIRSATARSPLWWRWLGGNICRTPFLHLSWLAASPGFRRILCRRHGTAISAKRLSNRRWQRQSAKDNALLHIRGAGIAYRAVRWDDEIREHRRRSFLSYL